MHNLIDRLSQAFSQALKTIFPESERAEITQATQEEFGHYQCNSALKLGKLMRENPRVLAQKILDAVLSQGEGMIATLAIAGPGFINITLSSSFLSAELGKMLNDPLLGVPSLAKQEKIIVEFSSPNVAKELHVGHLRSTIIGESLARLFEFLGYDVLRLNHIGDWGTQFGMLIAYIKAHRSSVEDLQGVQLAELMEWYKASKKKFDEDPEFKKRAQLEVVALQSGEPRALHAWKQICEISRKAFQEIYALLDVTLTERGESFYNPYLADLLADLTKKGLITLSGGAKCIFLDGFVSREGTPLPMIVQKSDGGYNYDTTDLAAVRYRVEQDLACRIICVTDSGQSLHFAMVFQAAVKAGYVDPRLVSLEHVPFGVVLGPDGKKFKTRSGETEKLIDLIQEAIQRAALILRERLPDASEEELSRLAKILGVDALKYADLSCHRIKDYVFSYDRMLKLEGNTAAFLLYAYVRIEGIKRKVGAITAGPICLQHPSEVALGLHLRQFGEALVAMSQELLPNRLTDYLYALAEKFHAFFRDCRVEGSAEEGSRLRLCELTRLVLRQGLAILGMQPLERM